MEEVKVEDLEVKDEEFEVQVEEGGDEEVTIAPQTHLEEENYEVGDKDI